MTKITTVNRTIPVSETIEEVIALLRIRKWLALTEIETYVYEFTNKPNEIKYINVVLNRDHIVEITE